VAGRFPGWGAIDASPEERPLVARRLVVPVELVDRLTEAAVFLRAGYLEASHLPELHAEDYAAPPPAWRPPADDVPGDVRLPAHRASTLA
jgi:hypothetical protein